MKKILILTWVVFYALIFISCNNKSGKKTENKTNSEIVIGAILPLTGDGATIAKYIRAGLELAIDEQNHKGGIENSNIKLVIYDSKSQVNEAVVAAQMLVKENPVVVFSAETSVCLAIKKIFENDSCIFIAGSSSEKLLDSTAFTYRNTITTKQSSFEVATNIRNDAPKSKVGMFFINNEWGRNSQELFSKNCNGLDLEFSIPFDMNATDYKVLIKKGLENNVDALFVVGFGRSLGTFIKQIKLTDYKGLIYSDFTANFPDVKEVAEDHIKGVNYVDFKIYINTQVDSLLHKYNVKYNENARNLHSMTVINYDALNVIFTCMQEAEKNGTVDIRNILNTEREYKGVIGMFKVQNYEFLYPVGIKKIN